MRIFMLGWEFPPFVAGGLGTACAGMTKALRQQGHDITFVLPKAVQGATSEFVDLVGPEALRASVENLKRVVSETRAADRDPTDVPPPGDATRHAAAPRAAAAPASAGMPGPDREPTASAYPAFDDDRFRAALGALSKARPGGGGGLNQLLGMGSLANVDPSSAVDLSQALTEIVESIDDGPAGETHYGHDLFGDAQRYARLVCGLGVQRDFDVIHANDWLTFPAGLALKALTGKPLVCHVHATEFDRSGENINQQVYDIERAGVQGADRVVAVSRLTKSILTRRYGAHEDRVDVVYNGVEQDDVQPHEGERIERDDKIVLFLGRITMQKGPEYFVRAAKRALEKIENVKFVVAGSGDMAVRMIDEAAQLGIGHKVLFTGFLRGRDVDRVFRLADCYVMPSVSEPFGIAPLEAMRNDTPVIVSKQSGVSEVLTHALKVDFWDVDEIANKIVAVLKYPPLSATLREHGAFELRGITWDGAAEKYVKVYGRAIASG